MKKEDRNRILLSKGLEVTSEEDLLKALLAEPISVDIDKEEEKRKTRSERLADWITKFVGSWKFIVLFSSFLCFWIVWNRLDPYPFILLNLILSMFSALQAPIILMSQNRSARKDSLRNQNDLKVDLKSELLLEELYHQMNTIIENQQELLHRQKEKSSKIEKKIV